MCIILFVSYACYLLIRNQFSQEQAKKTDVVLVTAIQASCIQVPPPSYPLSSFLVPHVACI